MIVVTDPEYGAVPGTDCTEAFKKAIKAWHSDGDTGLLVVPSGTYYLKGDIDLGRVRGGGFVGDGSQSHVGKGGITKHSCLAYIGPDGGTMFRYGGRDCVFDSLSFYGRPERQDAHGNTRESRAGILFQHYPGKGIGSGKTKFENCAFRYGDVGVRCGEELYDGNNDYLTYDTCSFRDLTVGYQVVGRHSVGHVFTGETYLSHLKIAFLFHAGGDFRLDHALLTHVDTYLAFPNNSSNNGIGINNATYMTGYLHYDNKQRTKTPCILNMADPHGSGNRIVSFDAIRMHKSVQRDDEYPLFMLAGDAFLHVQKFAHLRCDRPVLMMASGSPSKQPIAKFENCFLHDWKNPVTYPVNHSHWIFKECFSGKGTGMLPDRSHKWYAKPVNPDPDPTVKSHADEYADEYE